jgi:cytoskeletal protein RodZ
LKTIGQIIEEARKAKYYNYQKLEEITKIKSSFIEALEKENWQKLPAFPTVLGFVKSISGALDIDDKVSTAVLRRDYPPKKLAINPKPDISSKSKWNPKFTFIIGISLVVFSVLVYLGFQYKNFISPPKINLESPKDGQIVAGNSVLVFGATDPDAKITVNNQPVLVDDDGNFSVNIEVSSDTKEVVITSESRSGKTATVSRKIEVQE